MLPFLIGPSGTTRDVSQRMTFETRALAKANFIVSDWLPYPISYAEVPGYVFMANGFKPMLKWNGISYQAFTVGVNRPTIAPTLGAAGGTGIVGTYTAYYRWVDLDGNPSNLSPISNAVSTANASGFTYTIPQHTDDPKVTRLQILRNTTGQTAVYYVDIDTTDLTGESFSSSRTDTQLSLREAVPLFDTEGRSIANRFGVPMDHKPIICTFQGRMWAYGEIPYETGHAECTFGSVTVVGVGTTWVKAMEGRYFYAVDSPNEYLIEEVDVANQTLTLEVAFGETTDLFALYTIRPARAERRTLRFSEPGYFDAWPASNAFELDENGDDGTGLVASESYLFILQKRHSFRLTFNRAPLDDGGIFGETDRGCVNNRCHISLDSTMYMLDEQGIYSYKAGTNVEPLSMNIQDMFWTLTGDTDIRINWNAQRFFHAALFRSEATMKWFVSLDGSAKPKDALCYNYILKQWWVERFPIEIGSNCTLTPYASRTTPMVVGPNCKVFTFLGLLDQIVPASTSFGTAAAATLFSLTDTNAHFQASGLIGASVTILDGTGKGQQRRITGITGNSTTLHIDRPYLVVPDETSVYQIGGIKWLWKGIWSRWLDEDQSNVRRIILIFEPTDNEVMNVRMFRDHGTAPESWGIYRNAMAPEAVTVRDNDTDLLVNLQVVQGYAQIRMDGRRDTYLSNRDFFTLEMEGVSNGQLRLYGMIIEGTQKEQ